MQQVSGMLYQSIFVAVKLLHLLKIHISYIYLTCTEFFCVAFTRYIWNDVRSDAYSFVLFLNVFLIL